MANSASLGGDTWLFFGCDSATGVYSVAMTPALRTPSYALSRPTALADASKKSPNESEEQSSVVVEVRRPIDLPATVTEQEIFGV